MAELPVVPESTIPEFKDVNELRALMENDPALADKVLEEVRRLESSGNISNKPLEATVPDPAPRTDPVIAPVVTDPGVVPPDSNELNVTLKVSKDILGTYLGGKNKPRNPDEAVLEMLKGKLQGDKTIDWQKVKIQALEQQQRDFEVEKRRYEQELAALRAASVASNTPPATSTPPPAMDNKSLPVRPVPPKAPEGDDTLDTEKITAYNSALATYFAKKDEYDEAIYAKISAINKDDIVSDVKKDIESVRSEVINFKAQNEASANSQRASSAIQQQYDDADNFRTSHSDMFKSERTTQEIESDLTKFLKEIAEEIGSKDGIHTRNPDGSSTQTIKPEVWQAFQAYRDESTDAGKSIREAMQIRRAAPPEDYSDLDKVYKVLSLKKQHNLPWEKALILAKAEYPDLSESPEPNLSPKTLSPQEIAIKQKEEDLAARQRAAEARKNVATEPDPSNSLQSAESDIISMDELSRITGKHPRERTELEVQALRRVAAHFNWKEDELLSK